MVALLPLVLLGAALAGTPDPPLSCDAFRVRLEATLAGMGGLVEPPGPMVLAYDTPDTGKRFNWTGAAGLLGSLTCGKADEFQDFGIALSQSARTSDELPLALGRFTELAAASICALAEAEAGACRALARTMRDDSLAQFKAALANKDAVPVGSRDYFIVPGIDAEIELTPLAITWSIGPGQSTATGATRRKLDPKNVDE